MSARLGQSPSAASRTAGAPSATGSRVLRCAWLCALLFTGVFGCEQSDDVVANVFALSDAGPIAGSAAPPPPNCETSQLYVLFSSIVRNQCRLPSGLSTFLALQAYFIQNPPPTAMGETRPPHECDYYNSQYFFYYPRTNPEFLCPDHCAAANAYVVAEDQRVLRCQGF